MQANTSGASISKAALWTGRVISTLVALFLLFGAVSDLLNLPNVKKGMAAYGYPEGSATWIGLALLVSVILYLIPRSSVLGAILLTGYLGGAVSTHVRAGETNLMMGPVIFAALMWGGLFLRDELLRALLPLRR